MSSSQRLFSNFLQFKVLTESCITFKSKHANGPALLTQCSHDQKYANNVQPTMYKKHVVNLQPYTDGFLFC